MTETALPYYSDRCRRAFTLIELIVSMTVLTLLSTLLFGLLNSTNQLWSKAQAQLEPQRNGRAILDSIARDLRSAALPTDRTTTLVSTSSLASARTVAPPCLQLVINPSSLAAGYCNPQSLFWQAPVATNTTYGNLSEVGYFVRWDTTTSPGNPRASLCRFIVDPTDPTAPSSPPSNYLIYSYAQPANPQPANSLPANWITQPLLDTLAPGDATHNYAGWVADNVIALWVRALDVNGQPITQTAAGTYVAGSSSNDHYAFDSRQGYLDGMGNIKDGTSTQPLSALPASMEIAIVMIDPRTALRVAANLSPATVDSTLAQDPTKFWSDIAKYTGTKAQGGKLPDFVQQAAVVYTTRVPLANFR